MQDCSDSHEESAYVETLAAPDLLADKEDIDGTSETANPIDLSTEYGQELLDLLVGLLIDRIDGAKEGR